MSWLSKATGIHLGNIGAPIGAAVGSIIPGVGTALGAGLGQGLGKLGSGGSVGSSLGQGLATYGGAKVLGGAVNGAKTGGLGGILSGALGGLKSIPGVDQLGGLAGKLGGLGGGVGSALGGALGLGGGGASGGSGGGGITGGVNPLVLGLAGLQAANAAQLGKQSNDFANSAYKDVNDSYASRAGLRDQGIQGLMHPASHDLSELTRIRSGLGGTPSGGITNVSGANPISQFGDAPRPIGAVAQGTNAAPNGLPSGIPLAPSEGITNIMGKMPVSQYLG